MLDLKNPGIAGLCGGLIALFVYYINNKTTKNKVENINFFKLFILVFVIVYTIVYVNENNVFKKVGGHIHTGNPNF